MHLTIFQPYGRPFKVSACDINDTMEACVLRIEDYPLMLSFHMDNVSAARALGEAIVKAVDRHEQTLTKELHGSTNSLENSPRDGGDAAVVVG